MRKICTLLCMSFMLSAFFACSAFAADPFEVHEGGFGPKMKGLQLGTAMTLTEAANAWCRVGEGEKFVMRIRDVGHEEFNDLVLTFTKDGAKFTDWETSGTASKDFAKYQSLEELSKAVSEAGFSDVVIRNPSSVGSAWITLNGKNRVSLIELGISVFEAESMSNDDFIKALREAYDLPEMTRNTYKNTAEGWMVRSNYFTDGTITLRAIDISDGETGNFN